MEKIQTAWEFITSHPGHLTGEVDDETLMIEFAKIHVEAALKEASKKARTKDVWDGNTGSEYCDTVIDTDSIINCYPLENIK
jgi:hypothetical protein